MSLLKLPEIKAERLPDAAEFEVQPDALERWSPQVRAASSDDAAISIYDPIGRTWDGEGVTAKRISAALRSIGERDITVYINSPGGDFFEGVSIYNLLRQHRARVSVHVMGLAASAASVIAMAGDDILMGEASSIMIHNAQAFVIGNRHDLREASDWLAPFDESMAQLYAARTGIKVSDAAAMMDKETWINARQAVADGWATGLLDGSAVVEDEPQASGQRKVLATVDSALARAGYTRSQRRSTLQSLFSGTPSAAGDSAMPSAGADIAASLQNLLSTVRGTV